MNLTPLFLTTSKAGIANLPNTLHPPFNSHLHLKRHAVALSSRTVHPDHLSSKISGHLYDRKSIKGSRSREKL